MAALTFRPGTVEDVQLILEFIRHLAEYERLAHEVTATEEGLRLTLFGERKVAEVVFASLDGKEAGFALFFHNYSTFLAKPGLYLEDLFVLPEYRGLGVGKGLLRYLAGIALERDCGRFEWWVLDWNEPSIDFYRRQGAVAMDEWTVFRISGDALNQLAAN
ncbi:GNAT family N-acetyltransferase [bacterium]|nr:MAG: GNAT family N-acetyltransferase [bacterium]